MLCKQLCHRISCYFFCIKGAQLLICCAPISHVTLYVFQGLHHKYSDIVVSCGSGGTACALAIANHLTGSKCRVLAGIVQYSAGPLSVSVC